jgi:septum site-determining protein MinC
MSKSKNTKPALEIQGRLLSMTRVRVLDASLSAIEAQVKNLARQLGPAGEGMPVVLDSELSLDLPPILAAFRSCGLQPLAALEGALEPAARAAGLPVIPAESVTEGPARSSPKAEVPPPAPEPPPPAAPAPRRLTKIIAEPVRSGQQIYAQDADLVLLGTVNAGAEVIADGCVHVYGALRGRAIAGALGDTEARVFVRRNEADLIAVAGVYAVSDQIPASARGVAVQAYLVDGQLRIERLEP